MVRVNDLRVTNLSFAGPEDACCRAGVRAAKIASFMGRWCGLSLGSDETPQEACEDQRDQEDDNPAIWV